MVVPLVILSTLLCVLIYVLVFGVTTRIEKTKKSQISIPDRFCNDSKEPISDAANALKQRFCLDNSSIVTIDSRLLHVVNMDSGNIKGILTTLREVSNVFVVCTGPENSEHECAIKSFLKSIDFPVHRLLVASTEKGKVAIVRQLQSKYGIFHALFHLERPILLIQSSILCNTKIYRVHIDSETSFLKSMSPHIPFPVCIPYPERFSLDQIEAMNS